MVKKLNFLILFIIFLNVINIYGSTFTINSTYSVTVSGGIISENFDATNTTLHIQSCSGINLSFIPQTPLNDTKYSIYTLDGNFVQYSYNSYLFWGLPTGNYMIKDGNDIIMYYEKTDINPNTLYEVILTDNLFNEISDFSFDTLNSTQLNAAVKNLTTLEINSNCTPPNGYINWSLNGANVPDINAINLVEGDQICIGFDGIELCTNQCYGYAENCYTVNAVLKNSLFNINDIKIYPNPSNGILKIEHENIQKIKVVDNNNRILFEKNIKNNNYTLDITGFSKGIYFIIINSNEGLISKKIIKE